MPEVAGGWPEEGTAYPPGQPMESAPQPYPQQTPYPQQQGYPQPGYEQQQGYPQQPQQYPGAPAYQEQTVPQPAVFEQEPVASVPSEFDHLFRDSVPNDRRSISRQPMVTGPGPAPSPGFNSQPGQPPQGTAMLYQQGEQAQDYEQAPGGYNPQYGGPDGYDQDGGRPRSRRGPLLIGGVVVVVAAIGLYLGLGSSGSSGSKAPTASSTGSTAPAVAKLTAQQAADQLQTLVSEAKQWREDISAGADKLVACDISGATGDIGDSLTGRQQELASLNAIDVSKINQGTDLVNALKEAWSDSVTSDQNYQKAAQDFQSAACTKSAMNADPNYQAATAGSGDSTQAKEQAATLWNKIMPAYGKDEIGSSDL